MFRKKTLFRLDQFTKEVVVEHIIFVIHSQRANICDPLV